jgi:hypothetical protein
METLSAILQLFGKAGNIAALFASTCGLFAFIDNMSSTQARADFTKYLKSTDLAGSVVRLPGDTRALFERVFGPRHFSPRCLLASVLFSVASAAGMFVFAFLNNPKGAIHLAQLWWWEEPRFLVPIGVWVIWSVVPDYFNLLKTRIVLGIITARRINRSSVLIVILFADFLVGYVIFSFTYWPIFSFGMDVYEHGLGSVLRMMPHIWPIYLTVSMWPRGIFSLLSPLPSGILFWPGMVPSIWLWLYVGATLLVRLTVRTAPVFRFSMYLFDIDQHPIRSIGIVAAALASGAYAIVLAIAKFAQAVIHTLETT